MPVTDVTQDGQGRARVDFDLGGTNDDEATAVHAGRPAHRGDGIGRVDRPEAQAEPDQGDEAEERLQDRLILVVATGRPEAHQRRVAPEDDARRQRVARTRTRPQLIGHRLVEPELLSPRGEPHAGAAGPAILAEGDQVELVLLAGDAVDVGLAPRIGRYVLLEIGAVPAPLKLGGRLVQDGKALLVGRPAQVVDVEQFERTFDVLDLRLRCVGLASRLTHARFRVRAVHAGQHFPCGHRVALAFRQVAQLARRVRSRNSRC